MQQLDGFIIILLILGASVFLGRIYLWPLFQSKKESECNGGPNCGCGRSGAGRRAGKNEHRWWQRVRVVAEEGQR